MTHDPIITVTDPENQPHQYVGDPERLRTDFCSTNKEKMKTFEIAVRPLMQWINENCHPHHIVTVDHMNAQLFEGELSFNTEEYLKD